MPCYHPLKGYYSSQVNVPTGKRSLVFNSDKALLPVPVSVPCGRCIGCRLDRSLQWALRCVHEASLYTENCFITLTFNEKSISADRSLKVSDFQNFMKRLRQFIISHDWRFVESLGCYQYVSLPRREWKKGFSGVRFFHCGEYGVKFSRPHHHACLFGFDFRDKVFLKEVNGYKIYVSPTLDKLWSLDGVNLGFSTIGDVTFESAAYVARYVMKKWSKENLSGSDLYDAMSALSDDEAKAAYYGSLTPEYVTMSRRPGIGEHWYQKFKSDIYPGGFCIVNGKKVKPPKFYDLRFELDSPVDFAMMKITRIKKSLANPNNSKVRLSVREEVKKSSVKQLTRGYEYEG